MKVGLLEKQKTLIGAVLATASISLSFAAEAVPLSPMEELGKHLFFDKNLSEPKRQSCASCHDPRVGFASPSGAANRLGGAERGANLRRAGNRRPPTASYASFTQNFAVGDFGPAGGVFWDGRATGEVITADIFPDDPSWPWYSSRSSMVALLGPTADQAMGPFLNDVEQNLPSALELCKRVRASRYSKLYTEAWGEAITCDNENSADLAHKRIAFAVGVYEESSEFNSFSSKRDKALAKDRDGKFPLDDLSAKENLGHDLFYSNRGTCAIFCHSSSFVPPLPVPQPTAGTDPQELYVAVDPGYFNIGTPANPFNPWYRMNRVKDDDGNIINPAGRNWVDLGLGGRAGFERNPGDFKVPTVRNVGKVPSKRFIKAYFHNGYSKSLKGVVHFYNTRDMKPTCTNKRGKPERFVTERRALQRGCWPLPEVPGRNIFDCDDGDNCKVVLSEGETFETYCDDPNNPRNIGNLCLTDEEEDAIVAYLKTLSDTVMIKPPKKIKR